MANSTRFLQTAKNRIPFLKNVSTNFILLASLFVLSIIIYYMLNKRSLEHMENENENNNGSDKLVEGSSLMGGLANAVNRRNAARTTAKATGG
jgi:Na+/H+ antiporter NhaC